jgi:hypothetical protein
VRLLTIPNDPDVEDEGFEIRKKPLIETIIAAIIRKTVLILTFSLGRLLSAPVVDESPRPADLNRGILQHLSSGSDSEGRERSFIEL